MIGEEGSVGLRRAAGSYTFDYRADTALDKVSGGGSITIHNK